MERAGPSGPEMLSAENIIRSRGLFWTHGTDYWDGFAGFQAGFSCVFSSCATGGVGIFTGRFFAMEKSEFVVCLVNRTLFGGGSFDGNNGFAKQLVSVLLVL